MLKKALFVTAAIMLSLATLPAVAGAQSSCPVDIVASAKMACSQVVGSPKINCHSRPEQAAADATSSHPSSKKVPGPILFEIGWRLHIPKNKPALSGFFYTQCNRLLTRTGTPCVHGGREYPFCTPSVLVI